ncbi:uncharacterized protein LOC124326453 isoform X2 [Daphnia pulicaria]|uniref:uncharacterized protein LOC124326453 isoform X2 n=1 Tax=Daphnia pulicaria TaxID=35523 RepID=UPI001EEC3518|nr:uncharacterized protein LOC124326453 isoform X2 [Daphnia pulicaria]
MAPLSKKQMKKWLAVAGLNIILGAIVAIVQVVTLAKLYEWVDWICLGLWCGVFMISAGTLTIRRHFRLIASTVCAMLTGLGLIIFYAWNLGVYNNFSYSYYGNDGFNITTGPEAYCYYYGYNDQLCDWRMASDIIFIVCGSLALIVNLLLTMNAEAIVIVQPIVRYPVNNVYGTTNTTYMATSNQHPAANQQTVNQVPVVTYPSNNTNKGVEHGYQTSPPGYPPVNNNQQQQQQPV